MQYEVTLFVNYQQIVTVETESVLLIEELARATVNAPSQARVSVQRIEFVDKGVHPSATAKTTWNDRI